MNTMNPQYQVIQDKRSVIITPSDKIEIDLNLKTDLLCKNTPIPQTSKKEQKEGNNRLTK